jgi:hypothetical protein
MYDCFLHELPLFSTLWFNCPNCFEGNQILKVNVLVGSKIWNSIWFRFPEPLSDEKTMTVLLYWPVVFNVVTILPIAASSAEIIPRRMTWLSNSSWTALQSRQLILSYFFTCLKTQNTFLRWRNSQVLFPVGKTAWFFLLKLVSCEKRAVCPKLIIKPRPQNASRFQILNPVFWNHMYITRTIIMCMNSCEKKTQMGKFIYFVLGFVRYKYLSVDIVLLAVEIHELSRNLVWGPMTSSCVE